MSSETTSIKLLKQEDWPTWFNFIRSKATAAEIWKFMNPDEKNPPINVEPDMIYYTKDRDTTSTSTSAITSSISSTNTAQPDQASASTSDSTSNLTPDSTSTSTSTSSEPPPNPEPFHEAKGFRRSRISAPIFCLTSPTTPDNPEPYQTPEPNTNQEQPLPIEPILPQRLGGGDTQPESITQPSTIP
jgi:hypothetical protein